MSASTAQKPSEIRSRFSPARHTIGVVSHFPPPPGGIPAQAEALANGLEREGFRVLRLNTHLGWRGVLGRLDGVRRLRTLLRIPVFFSRVARAVLKADLIHILSYSGIAFFAFTTPAVLMAKLFGRKVVLHYHGGDAEWFLNGWHRSMRPILAKADVILVPSQFLVDVFGRFGIRTEIVPNVVSQSEFPPLEERPVRPVYVVARHLEPVYNVPCAIRAFAKVRQHLPEAHMYVLGGGSLTDSIHALVKQLGLDSSIDLLGYVPPKRVQEIYSQASVFVNSSNVDNVPIAILEAFSSGLPVVTTNAGGIPYMVEDGRTGLLVPMNDPEALAARMIEVVQTPGLARSLRENGFRELQRYDWPHVYELLRHYYVRAGLTD